MDISPEVLAVVALLDERQQTLADEQTQIQSKAELETKLYTAQKKLTTATRNLDYYRDLVHDKLIKNPAYFGDAVLHQIETLVTAILIKQQPNEMAVIQKLQSEVDRITQELGQ